MNANTGKVARHQELIQFDRPGDRLDKNDNLDTGKSSNRQRNEKAYLVELQGVQQIIQLPVLLSFFELHVVLLQSVQS